ncbi:MAG: hypothetical protein RL734_1617 [Bacteroidota bacterium]|jgi:hypothetical protein
MNCISPCVNKSDELNSECELVPKDINGSTYIIYLIKQLRDSNEEFDGFCFFDNVTDCRL